jgi:hypothetical protein
MLRRMGDMQRVAVLRCQTYFWRIGGTPAARRGRSPDLCVSLAIDD